MMWCHSSFLFPFLVRIFIHILTYLQVRYGTSSHSVELAVFC